MQRILDPTQIEPQARRSIARVKLPERASVFARRASRLRELSAASPMGDYLGLMAALVAAQHEALARLEPVRPSDEQIARAQEFGMPLFDPDARAESGGWRQVLSGLVATLAGDTSFPAGVAAVCARLTASSSEWLEAQADALLAQRGAEIDPATAPFLMAALQVVHTARACALSEAEVPALATLGVCPVCGSLPVASIVHVTQPYQGYRFLHCALCATEWHRVRVQCTTCDATKDIGYHSIADAPDAVRAESCESCKTYRKILYPEKDPGVEPVADDLASVALDLLLGAAGYARASANPLLWQRVAG